MTRATFILLVGCVVLWTVVCQINHYLTTLHVSVFVGGLLVTFSALRVGFREGWWCSILIGLLIDSSAAVYFGFHAMTFAVVHTVIFNLRGRFPREETVFGVIVALLANVGLFIAITIALIHRTPTPLTMLTRLLVDLLASELLILVLSPWFFALMEHSLEIGGVSLRRQQRGLR
jgi:cell shape-determining protein MreD